MDIGSTVQKQYHGGALRISEWAHLINASVLAGDGLISALTATGTSFEYGDQRGLLILAEMTTKGSLATGTYTQSSIESARYHSDFVVGFVATQALIEMQSSASEEEDFVVFTTGVNRGTKGDKLGQQYQTPESAVKLGADFIIAGRGIYATEDPKGMAKLYKEEGWSAYLARTA